jgi:hypothetical protein
VTERWRTNLKKMPTRGLFEVLCIREVFRDTPTSEEVIEPKTGRMYVPRAWRPITKKQKPKRNLDD